MSFQFYISISKLEKSSTQLITNMRNTLENKNLVVSSAIEIIRDEKWPTLKSTTGNFKILNVPIYH